MSKRTSRWLCVVSLLALASVVTNRGAAQSVDIVRGHVRSVAGAPVRDGTVRASGRDRIVKSAQTDSLGAFVITFAAGAGPYTVGVTALGFASQSRVIIEPAAGAVRPDVDFQLTPQARQLATVAVRAVRTRVQRSDADRTGVGEAGRDNISGALGGDVTGDLTSVMGTVPGLLIAPDPNGGLPTISAFGLSGDQNSLTLNGMNFGAGGVPRDGLVLRVASSTYDAGRGGFSGVQTSLRLPSGGNFINQTLHVTLESRALQGPTPLSAQFGNQYTRGILSGAWSGPIVEDKAYYSTSFQVSRRSSDLATLTSSNGPSLQSLGFSADSISRLTTLAQALGIPITTAAVPSDRVTTNASLFSRFDWSPRTTSRAGQVLYLLASGNYADNGGTRSGPTAFAGHAAQSRSFGGQLQLNSSRFIKTILNEGSVSLVTTDNHTSPYLLLPDGRILINSSFADGTSGSATARVGGNASADSRARTSTAQLRNETSWFTMSGKHQLKVTVDGQVNNNTNTQGTNRLGSYTYNSLADFAASRPASFSRTLADRQTSGRQYLGAIGVGDVFRPRPTLRVQYGLRLEGNAFGVSGQENPAVATLFGGATGRAPRTVTLAPMVGFTRTYNRHGGGSFTGGVREYVGGLSSQTVENVQRLTGLPDAVQQLSCVGSAVPIPAWSSYGTVSAIPGQCSDGSGVFSQTSPQVSLFASGYAPSRRWGGALGWSGRMGRQWIGSVTSNTSFNTQRSSATDLNFSGASRFVLAAEGGRPVYVLPTSIAATSGALVTTDSRRSTQFSQVSQLRSDLRSNVQQFVFGLASAPTDRPRDLRVSTTVRAYYTFTAGRDQSRGFGGGTTGADPSVIEWGTTGLPAHAVQLLGTVNIPGWFSLNAFGRLSSGRQYTPLVSGDINGDGFSNDRAFVFDAAKASDATLASAMQKLLAASPAAARDCLTSQLGRVASRNSCRSPWTQALNLSMSIDPHRMGLGDRGSVSLVVTNALAAADQLLHGADKLHYWGTNAAPDATLLNVRGFDPNTKAFRYDVNPLFGSTIAARSSGRVPFVVSVDVRLRLGPDRDAQQIRGFLKPRAVDGRKVLGYDQIMERLTKDEQNNFGEIVQRKQALKLTPAQETAINVLAKGQDTFRDSVYASLAKYLVSVNGNYRTREVKQRWHDAFVGIARRYVVAGPRVRSILGEEQFAALPVGVNVYFDMDEATFDRIMRNADFGTLLELITGEGID